MRKQKLHLRAPKNWMNDPNGFIYYRGKYHLFYQYFPYEPVWATMHWGHAVSEDLVTWEQEEIALYPSNYWDQNGCFSGSAVEAGGKLYLFYTGVRYEETAKEDIHHCLHERFESAQLRIVSEDGIRFDNFHDKKLIIPPVLDEEVGDKTHTRDPKVWLGGNGFYYMVLGSTQHKNKGKLLFYRSKNGEDWEYLSSYVPEAESLGWMWECPDLFEVNGKWILCFSAMGYLKEEDRESNQSLCVMAHWDEETGRFSMAEEDSIQFVDYGLDLYAPQSTLDAEGRRVIVAWARMPEPVREEHAAWIGMMCAPRVVTVENNHIFFRLHPNVEAAFTKEIILSESKDLCDLNLKRNAYDFSNPCFLEISLQDGEELWIGGYGIHRQGGHICTDRSRVYRGLKKARQVFRTPDLSGKEDSIELKILASANLIEVYINHGEYVISSVVYELTPELCLPCGKKYVLQQMPDRGGDS